MEYQVLQDNTMLQVAFTVNIKVGTKKSEKINFNNRFIFRAKVITYLNSSIHYNEYSNIVLINTQKLDKDDKTKYTMKLSCPEFDIQGSILSSDDDLWHVINENENSVSYTFTIMLQAEAVAENKFSVLYEDEKLTDFKLKGRDGEINIHKAFLAATSTFFRSMLLSPEDIDSLEISDTSVNTLKNFKRCIYTEVLPDENVEELLLVASFFKIRWLEYKCVDKMMENMSSSNVIKFLELALKHKHMPLFLGIMGSVQDGRIKMSEIRKFYLCQQ